MDPNSFVPGALAAELVRDLQRAPGFPPYADRQLDSVHGEVTFLVDELIKGYKGWQSAAPGTQLQYAGNVIVHDSAIRRNKRCILAYLHHRLRMLMDARFTIGRALPEEMRSNMSRHEQIFFQKYSDLVSRYSAAVGLDITIDAEPPKGLYISVRVGDEDCGQIVTEDGVLHLRPLAQLRVRRQYVEHLIRQGKIVHIL
jgi:GINS complex subunit 1